MSFADEFKAELIKQLGRDKVVFCKGWRNRGDAWQTANGLPVGSLHHHTAGAATSSTDPRARGNQKGANAGVISWCQAAGQSHAWANCAVDRDGTVYIFGIKSQWHAGLGDFKGTRWESLGVKKDRGNYALWGTELVSKGTSKDLTKAQKKSMYALDVVLRKTCGWPGFSKRLMNHKDWTSRKNDSLYSWSFWVRHARAAWITRKR